MASAITLLTSGGLSDTPWRDVTDAQLRHWTGNFCGPALDRIAPSCPQDPVTRIHCQTSGGRPAHGLQAGVCFSTHLLNYPPTWWDEIIAAQGSHVLINISDDPNRWGYSGIYPPAPSDNRELLNAALKAIWFAGKIPVCVAIGYHDKDTDEAADQLIALLDDPYLVRLLILGMEMNDDASRPAMAARFLRWSAKMPHALIYDEYTPGHGAMDTPEADCYGDGWRADQIFYYPVYGEDENGKRIIVDIIGEAHGYDWPGFQNIPNYAGRLVNDDHYDDDQKLMDETGDLLCRLKAGGFWGLRRSLDVILFETVAVPRFWENRSLASCDAHNRYVLDRAYHQDFTYGGVTNRLAGYCNGGR